MAAKQRGRPIHGWIVLDKPQGMSSAHAVAAVRRSLDAAKAGHGGTLDPLATGVLPIALGEATKTVAWAMAGHKTYRFTIRWGEARDSDDAEGRVVATSPVRPSATDIAAALPRFVGLVEQRPPAFSALKLAGERAYVLARAGERPDLAPRPVEILELRLLAVPDRDHAEFEAVVGKGTYIRALARDLAAALGTLGHVAALRRLSVGPFTEAQAISLEFSTDSRHLMSACRGLLPIEAALDGVPAVVLAAADADGLRCGRRVVPGEGAGRAQLDELAAGTVVSAWHNHALIALARIEDGALKPLRVINC